MGTRLPRIMPLKKQLFHSMNAMPRFIRMNNWILGILPFFLCLVNPGPVIRSTSRRTSEQA